MEGSAERLMTCAVLVQLPLVTVRVPVYVAGAMLAGTAIDNGDDDKVAVATSAKPAAGAAAPHIMLYWLAPPVVVNAMVAVVSPVTIGEISPPVMDGTVLTVKVCVA